MTMADPPYERARETVNPDRLLPGEEVAIHDPEADAGSWRQVYEELLVTKRALTDYLAGVLPHRSEVARRELEEFDLTIIKAQEARFRVRLAYWDGRARTTPSHPH
jgi:hypothetical protein